jgi:nucleoside-diphosphate-sugar epimerase
MGRESAPFRRTHIDAIIHTATCYSRGGESVPQLLEVNLLLPVLLAHLAIQNQVPLFINTDTYFNVGDEAYSSLPDYSLSKHHAWHWLQRTAAGTGIRMANMRIEHMYGPGDRREKFCPSVFRALVENQMELQLTTGEQTRDFIYVEDVAEGFLAVLENWKSAPGEISEFGVGWGRSIPIHDFVKLAHRLADSRSRLRFGALPSRPKDFVDSRADNRTLRALGWAARIDLETGISRTLESLNALRT